MTGARRFDLVCFDVDGTLIVHPENKVVWQVLNRRFLGSHEVNDRRFRDYRDGRIAYADWVALDVGDWQAAGATRSDIIAGLGELSLMKGAREAVSRLKDAGCRLAVVSGTIDLCLDLLFPDHPFDEVHTNRIAFDGEGRISGWTATPYDMEGKAVALREICAREGIPRNRCAFVGDHENDIAAAREAGYSIAFNPKSPKLEAAASLTVRSGDLRDLLPHLTI